MGPEGGFYPPPGVSLFRPPEHQDDRRASGSYSLCSLYTAPAPAAAPEELRMIYYSRIPLFLPFLAVPTPEQLNSLILIAPLVCHPCYRGWEALLDEAPYPTPARLVSLPRWGF